MDDQGQSTTFRLAKVERVVEPTLTIHLGYLSHTNNSFTEFPDGVFTVDDITGDSIIFRTDSLVTERVPDGYSYVGIRYNATPNTTDTLHEIAENADGDIRRNGTQWRADVTSTATSGARQINENQALDATGHIYVFFEPTGTDGYTPPSSGGSSVNPDEVAPNFQKLVTENPDGTYTIRLDITGHEAPVQTGQGANVIVVVDNTSSMRYNMSGTQTSNVPVAQQRITAARAALHALASALYPEGSSSSTIVNTAFIEFNNTSTTRNWMTTKGAIDNYIDNTLQIPDSHGTNWEAGLRACNTLLDSIPNSENLKNNKTYIIFMTDGDTNRCMETTLGNNSSYEYSAQAAAHAQDDANAIATKGYLYGVFCGSSSGGDRLANLISAASGVDTFEAADAEELEATFAGIGQLISKDLGSSDVNIDDGLPTLSSIQQNVSGEAADFVYYKDGELWTGDDVPEASYDPENGVVWNLASLGTLDEAVYSIEFTIWPTQDSYDLIADLNNGIKSYDSGYPNSITDAEREQVEHNPDGSYTLKTNTHLKASYYNEIDGQTYNPDNIQYEGKHMPLPTNTIKIVKTWHNEMDTREASNVELTLMKGDEVYETIEMGEPVETIPGKEWEQRPTKEIYISVGLMSCDDEGNLHVFSPGHDYTVVEPESFSYRWDLTADIYHPMIINDAKTATVLIEVPDDEVPAALKNLENNKKATDGGNTYYKFDNLLYVAQDGANVLEAQNDRRSNLIISKTVNETNAPEDDTFAIKVTLDNPNAPYPGDEGYSDWYHTMWFYVSTEENDRDTIVTEGVTVEGATPEEGNTGYWWFHNGGTVTVYLKAGQYLNFNNMAKGTTYTIEELDGTNMPEGYLFDKVETEAVNKQAGGTSTPGTVDEDNPRLVTGTIDKPNTDYKAKYTNKYLGFFYVYHSSDNTVQRFPIVVNGVKVTDFNIFELTNPATFYGGYYEDYLGKSPGFDAAALEYVENEATDEDGEAYTYAYIKDNDRNVWNYSEGYPEKGTAMDPVENKVYYLKEVPTAYLLPYTHYTYNKSDKLIRNIWYISSIDDLCYQETGFFVEAINKSSIMDSTNSDPKVKIVDTLTVTNATGGATVTLSPKSVFGNKGGTGNGVQAGYISYWDAVAKIGENKSSEFTPFWLTKDGIYVCGVSTRTIQFNSAKVGSGGMRIADVDNTTIYPTIE